MRPIRPTRLAAALAALALVLAPSVARADGDPASDYLLIQDTFLPFQFKVSPNVAAALQTTVARAKAAGYPLKVAIISAPTDLGAVPDLFGQPQRYADFLDREISFNKQALLLVVMPQGFGVSGTGPASVLAGRTIPAGTGSDRLARAAIPAVGALAAHAGHPISLPAIGAAAGSSGGTSALLTFGAPLALVLLVAGGAALFKSRGGPAEPLFEDEDEDEDDDDDLDEADEVKDGAESGAAGVGLEAVPADPPASAGAAPVGPVPEAGLGPGEETGAGSDAARGQRHGAGTDSNAVATHPNAAAGEPDAAPAGPGEAEPDPDGARADPDADPDADPPKAAVRPVGPPGTGG